MRVLYSSDASNHQVEPLGVAFPRDEAEVAEVVALAHGLGFPLVPRGAGTSLAGQAVGAGLVLDLSRHLRRVAPPEPGSRTLSADAGAVLSRANAVAASAALAYGPDPASADRATIGGVIGNNASGSHSIRYGMTADHVRSLRAVLSDGSVVTLGPVSEEEAERREQGVSLEAGIYRKALDLRVRSAPAVSQVLAPHLAPSFRLQPQLPDRAALRRSPVVARGARALSARARASTWRHSCAARRARWPS